MFNIFFIKNSQYLLRNEKKELIWLFLITLVIIKLFNRNSLNSLHLRSLSLSQPAESAQF